jgi:hypothetical protein
MCTQHCYRPISINIDDETAPAADAARDLVNNGLFVQLGVRCCCCHAHAHCCCLRAAAHGPPIARSRRRRTC